ncbi:MAG: cupin domain-containing protein [Pseudomonadota bacterium]
MTTLAYTLRQRLVRYDELIACRTAFIDARTPGSDQKENFTIIGPGVAENPGQHVHVRIPHGFNIGAARQPKGCINSQHSHVSEEVFMVHRGAWRFMWGEDGSDGDITLHEGEVISIPINVFRGFECVSDEPGFLFAILGRDDPGHVTWAPYVFEQARDHGLVLLESGRLFDTVEEGDLPHDDRACAPTSADEAAAMRRMSADEMRRCVIRQNDYRASINSAIAQRAKGVTEAPILGPANAAEHIDEGEVATPHGFVFRRLSLQAHACIPPHTRAEEEVLFVHQGEVEICVNDARFVLREGDTFTTPIGAVRSLRESDAQPACVFVVRRGDMPVAPLWLDQANVAVR